MSVTLRYHGTLDDAQALARLREDFLDIAATHGWPVDVLEREAPSSRQGRGRLMAPPLALEGLKVIVHPQTDPLWLTFDETGILTRLGAYPLTVTAAKEGRAQAPKFGVLHQAQASIQTSIGGFLLHSTVVSLLDYLKRAYVSDLQVNDETGYWDDRDLSALKRRMDGR